MHEKVGPTFNPLDFLTKPLPDRGFYIDHYQKRLASRDGHRTIWTRIIYDHSHQAPQGAILALSVNHNNLMVISVPYAGQEVGAPSISIGVGFNDRGPNNWDLHPEICYWANTSQYGYWSIRGSVGMEHHSAEFQDLVGQGLYSPEVLNQPIDVQATAAAFLGQVNAYLLSPDSFEPSASPNLQPRLIARP